MKKYLLTGLLVWVPLGITIWVLNLTISTLDQSLLLLPVNWYPDKLLGIHIPGLGVILTVVIVIGTGLLVHNVLGQRLLSYWEGLLRRIPVVSSIYHSVKQVSDTLLSSNGLAFRKVLLVRYPHPEAWALAFQTAIPGEVTQQLKDEYVGVFIPTAPSPVNGFYFYVRRADTIELNISVDVALKSIISMGVVVATPAVPYTPEN
ncbi:MAG: putative membrane protein [Candidatus Nitrotoga sp. SPKER]|nr:MAG: putative membrane protein [Candidatus Nitrotoga sp. SPKER]